MPGTHTPLCSQPGQGFNMYPSCLHSFCLKLGDPKPQWGLRLIAVQKSITSKELLYQT